MWSLGSGSRRKFSTKGWARQCITRRLVRVRCYRSTKTFSRPLVRCASKRIMEAKWSRSQTAALYSDWLDRKATLESRARKSANSQSQTVAPKRSVPLVDVSSMTQAWEVLFVWPNKEIFSSRDTNLQSAASLSDYSASRKMTKAATCAWKESIRV